ncbi:MAG: hypothetical protein K0Q49_1749 [Haloplasmataceae bacterium]|jgi:protein-S-isoprenylcysteine O-methyltransferase Ste14|nr:hypothetical protein [Haloplasmataceae bacterium]
MKIYGINILLLIIILLPNLLYIIFPPRNVNIRPKKQKGWFIVIAFEKVGQLGIFITPLFFKFKIDNSIKIMTLIIMCLACIMYYICWIRYVKHQSDTNYLSTPFLKIQIPLVISPIIYFTCIGFILESWIMLLFTVIFAFGHILESLHNINSRKDIE